MVELILLIIISYLVYRTVLRWLGTDETPPSETIEQWNELPTPEQFKADISKRASQSLHPELRDRILSAQEFAYKISGIFDKTLSAKQQKRLHGILLDQFVRGLDKLTLALPDAHIESTSSVFKYKKTFDPDQLIPLYQRLTSTIDLKELKPLFEFYALTPYPLESNPGKLIDRYRSYMHDESPPDPDVIKRQWERDTKQYDKDVLKAREALSPMKLAMEHTPYWYLADTLLPTEPIERPFTIPDTSRFAGMWVIGPPGRGKSNLLHNLIAEDRKHGTVVLMDSKGDLINAYRNDAIVIEPATANINPLQLGSSTRTVEFLEYIFSALLDTSMTPLQKTLFRSVLTLLLQIPNATLETFRVVLTSGYKPYAQYLETCDPATADFFLKGEFDSKTYSETKTQILWRLRLILSNDYLRAIFTAPETNVPFNELLDSKKLIIIDNSTDMLGEEGAEFFGRFFVALIWMTAVGRSRLRPEDKVPVYFYIDEAQTVIKRDTKIATILDTCRSQKIALVLAHQRIGQIEPNVIDALNNCAIRLANSDDDAEALAKRFRVDASALRLPVGQFSCFVRDLTPQAVTINIPLFETKYVPPPKPPVIAPQRTTEPIRVLPTDEVEDF